MRWIKYFLTIWFSVIIGNAYCQKIDPLLFIYSQISKYSDSERLIYTDRITNQAYRNAKNSINQQFYDGNNSNKKIAFRFTKKERQYILQQLKHCTNPYWSDSLFSNSKMIKLDSFHQHFRTKNNARRKIIPLLETPGYSREFRSAMIKELGRRDWVFIFSKPIYLRNNSLVVLYLEPRCGWDCGYDELAVYRINKGLWEKWISIFQGAY